MEAANMKRHNELLDSAIWLLADSPPPILLHERFDKYEPLDWRFPTRHSIWTPIETIINRELFQSHKRIDDSKFYVRNAVELAKHWSRENKAILAEDVKDFRRLVDKHSPYMILTFGQRAFEFARRSQEEKPKTFRYWRVERLLEEFDTRITRIQEGKVILLPLLHAVIAQKFDDCHKAFGGNHANYFEHVGCSLAEFLRGQTENERISKLLM
jgi:hypothetical protein